MPANTSPLFALVPQVPTVTITGTTTDKSMATLTNVKLLYTAGSNGTKITQIGFKPVGNSTAGLLLIWITDISGNNPILYDEIAIPAITSSTTVATARSVNTYSDLQLQSGQKLYVAATVVNTNIYAFAQVGDF